ncbi:MAG: AmmeMemoRadiSam system protein B, partial [bacterium]|nr:AmmeMemoRadiSam system protein B [bacterium]
MIIRPPTVNGHFYPADAQKLTEQIQSLIPKKKGVQEPVLGIIVPHAGYQYCGKILAATYQRVLISDTLILLGPNHSGKGEPLALFPRGIWQTPLGDVEIDTKLALEIKLNAKGLVEEPEVHTAEHAIEVQLPMLQYFAKKKFLIVPISIAAHKDAAVGVELGFAVARAISALSRKVTIIATTDLTQDESQEMANRKDQRIINSILRLEPQEVVTAMRRYGAKVCGSAAVVAMLTAVKELGASQAELVQYGTSGDATGDYSKVWGFAGI